MESRDHLVQQRIEKLNELRARGINPYPYGYHPSHTTKQSIALLEQAEASGKTEPIEVSVAGRIMAQRSMGKVSFMDLRDGSGKIQLFMALGRMDEASAGLLKDIDIGDIIGASGKLIRTRTKEPSIEVKSFTLLAKSLQTLPEKWHGLSDVDKRYRQRYVDLIANPEAKDTFQKRSRIISAIRAFLDGRGFIEVETPVLQSSAGGALAKPFVTHHNALDQDLYLRIALELHLKRLIVGGLDKVYELGRVFRNEGIDAQHNPEFTMMESYEAYADYNDVMKMLEDMVAEVSRKVNGSEEAPFDDGTISFKPPWKRLSLRQAVADYAGIDFVKFSSADELRHKMKEMKMEADPNKNWAKLVDDLVSTFVQPKLIQPTFLIDYPLSMSPLAKKKPDNDRVVERFEAFIGGMEVANAFTELNDPIDQRERFVEQMKERHGANEETWTIDEDFLLAMEYGMPPTGGLGVGIDRLVMLLTNQRSIREVVLFPQLKEKG